MNSWLLLVTVKACRGSEINPSLQKPCHSSTGKEASLSPHLNYFTINPGSKFASVQGRCFACCTSEELIGSVTHLIIGLSCTWSCSCFTAGRRFTFGLGRCSVSLGTVPEAVKSCWGLVFSPLLGGAHLRQQQGSCRHYTPALCMGQEQLLSFPSWQHCHPAAGLLHIPACYDEISFLNDRLLGGRTSTYHTWSVNLQITVLMILGSHCVFFRAVWLIFIMGICNEGNYMTFSSTELNKLPVYPKVCNPFSKDNM